MSQTAWVFTGQGSQFVGMGRDLYDNYEEARSAFEQADDALGFKLSRLLFDGPEAELTDTANAQPAILAHSVAILRVMQRVWGTRLELPRFTAGHSLGEYSALVAANAIGFADAVRLVRARGEAMKRAGEEHPGAMAAILALNDRQVMSVCEEAGAVQVANFNAPGQIVISGESQALDRAVELAKQAGAKRAIRLAVSIAAHSELMRPAVESLRAAVMDASISQPEIPVIANVTATLLDSVAAIREELLAQLTAPVQWVKSVEFMASRGVRQFFEIGPKDVLSGLIRRIAKEAEAASVRDRATLESAMNLTQGNPA